MAFTASELPVALARLDTILLGKGMQDVKMNWPSQTALAIAENQTVNIEPVRPDDPCTEVDAWFYQSGSSYLIESGTAPDALQGCDLKAVNPLATESVRFGNNYHVKSGFSITKKRCDNASRAIDEIARGLATSMAENRRAFNNKHAVAILVNNIQENVATPGTVDNFTDQGAVANLLKMDPSQFNYAGLRAMEILAMGNHLSDTVFTAGGAFYQAADLAQFDVCCEGGSTARKSVFDSSTLYWDTKNLDPAVRAIEAGVTAPIVFGFDPSIFLCWSTQLYGGNPLNSEGDATGMAEDPSKNYYTFSVADPILSYRDGGRMVPFYHNVEMTFECVGRDKAGRKQYGYQFNVTMSGGLHKAPNGHNWAIDDSASAAATLTGIIAVTAEV